MVATLVLVVAAVVAPRPADAAVEDFPTACPELTDSVFRLYSAYFLREPDQAGWDYWAAVYGSAPNTNLEVISDSFARSDEFRLRYGSLTDQQFVELVYANVLGRQPDPQGLAHWVGSLSRGYPRGSVMMAFSESAEYVNRTATVAPLAGYLMWYDRGMRFDCALEPSLGQGTYEHIGVPTDITSPYVDLLLVNASVSPTSSTVFFIFPGYAENIVVNEVLQPGEYLYLYNVPVPKGAYQVGFTSGVRDLQWSIVYYDHPHSADRPGWD